MTRLIAPADGMQPVSTGRSFQPGPIVTLLVVQVDSFASTSEFLLRACDELDSLLQPYRIILKRAAADKADDAISRHKNSGVHVGSPTGAGVRCMERVESCPEEPDGNDIEFLLPVDGDLDYSPGMARSLLQPLLDGRADIAIASRYINSGWRGGHRAIFFKLVSLAVRVLLGLALPATRGISDPSSDIFAFRRDISSSINWRQDDLAPLVEILARSSWKRVVEIQYPLPDQSARAAGPRAQEIGRLFRSVAGLITTAGRRESRSNGLNDAGAPLLPDVRVASSPALTGSTTTTVQGRRSQREAGGSRRLRGSIPAARRYTWAALGTFLIFQIVTSLTLHNGPFLDEGIYITAGERTWQGHGISDGYLGWFAGSLLWPTIAGVAFKIGGLAGARISAAIVLTIGLAAASRATRNLFGDHAAFYGVAAVMASATTLQLGHLAVYDVIAIAGLGISLSAVTDLQRTGHRGWLVLAAAGLSIAVLGKYPALFFLPVVIAAVVVLRRRAALVDLAILMSIFTGVMLIFFMPWRYQLVYFLQWRMGNNPSFGVTRGMVIYEQVLYGALFAVLAVVGVAISHRGHRWIAIVLGASVALFPAYHIMIANGVSALKHDVFGYTMAMPVIGVALARFASRNRIQRIVTLAAIAVFTLVGVHQMHRMDKGWGDAEPGGNYLAARVQPGDRLLVTNAWQVLPYLYGHGVTDPAALTDAYGFNHAASPINICGEDWFINTTNDNAWSDQVLQQMRACGSFVEVFRSSSSLTNLSEELRYVTYRSDFVVYKNTGRRS